MTCPASCAKPHESEYYQSMLVTDPHVRSGCCKCGVDKRRVTATLSIMFVDFDKELVPGPPVRRWNRFLFWCVDKCIVAESGLPGLAASSSTKTESRCATAIEWSDEGFVLFREQVEALSDDAISCVPEQYDAISNEEHVEFPTIHDDCRIVLRGVRDSACHQTFYWMGVRGSDADLVKWLTRRLASCARRGEKNLKDRFE